MTGQPAGPPRPPLLEVEHVDAGYGPYRALFDVSLSVPEASVVALVGANGAGKSTLARVVSGLVRASAGRVRFAGADITGWPAWRIARHGLAHAPEGRSVFATLTVEENLVLPLRAGRSRREADAALGRALRSFPRLEERRDQLAGTLSGGEQRMLALARVLAVPQRLLVVDELSMGLAPAVVDEVLDSLAAVREAGTALLVVEQQAGRILDVADRVVVLAQGRVVREGDAAGLRGVVPGLPGSGPPAPASRVGAPTIVPEAGTS